MINFKVFKKDIENQFVQNNIDSSEVNILFCEALNLQRVELLTKTKISVKEQKKVLFYAKKRLLGMPIQKIFKKAYFFEYVFFINNNVLCPRPETEILVQEYLKVAKKEDDILDLCTGSGCIAITVQKKLAEKFNNSNFVVASDVSKKALDVAKKNALKLGADVKFIRSNMFEKINKKFDVILSNPPYIKNGDLQTLDIEVKNYDPLISLDGGEDGLKFYRIIAKNAKNYLKSHGKIFLEIGFDEATQVVELLKNNGFDCFVKKDYNNIDRLVIGELLW